MTSSPSNRARARRDQPEKTVLAILLGPARTRARTRVQERGCISPIRTNPFSGDAHGYATATSGAFAGARFLSTSPWTFTETISPRLGAGSSSNWPPRQKQATPAC